jgi:serine/threonine-protein kinase
MIGKIIQHYKILEKLGSGGMGTVYKAKDTKLDRFVALKFLAPHLSRAEEEKKRFIHEAKAASALDHPNICNIYEIDETRDGQMFIAMACYDGESLKEKIEHAPLPVDEVIDIAIQIAQGLAKAHSKKIMHRDIKPANILITKDRQIKIVDFGLAKLAGRTMLTKEGTTLGTVAYMSPEQTLGTDVDHQTDIWALGVILYEMLTGERPFKGDYEQAVMYSIMNEEPEPVTDLRPEIPISLGQVVIRALEKKPEKRYKHIEELLDDLKSISAGIVPDEIKVRLRKAKLFKRKRGIIYTVSAGLIIMAVIALNLFTGRAQAIDSIAVLPLKNLTGDTGLEYFVDGITDELIGQLGQISGLKRVISRTSVMQYKETDKSLSDIAWELNVDAVIEGTVYQAGDSIRVRFQLIDVLPEEQNLWGETYERPMREVLMMYSDVARAVASEIRIGLTRQEETRFTSARQINTEAYEAYLKGMSYIYKLNPQDIEVGMHYFESALEKDPDFALAYTGIALGWCLHQVMGSLPPSETTPLFRAAAQRALDLDSTLAEAHYAWAFVKWFDWDWKGAEEAFKRAIEINPNYPDARVQYSQLLVILKRPEEAIVQAQQAVELDPFNPVIMGLYGSTLSMAGRYDEAMTMAYKELRVSPNSSIGLQILWLAHHFKGEYDQAFESAKAHFTAMGMAPIVQVMKQGYDTGGYFEAMGCAAEAMAFAAKEHYIQPFWIALLFATAGEIEQCLDWLEKGYETKDPMHAYFTELELRSLIHDEPRYQDLLRKMNLPVED